MNSEDSSLENVLYFYSVNQNNSEGCGAFDNLADDLIMEEEKEEDPKDYFGDAPKRGKKKKIVPEGKKVEIQWTTGLCDTFVSIVFSVNAHKKTLNSTLMAKWTEVVNKIKLSYTFQQLGVDLNLIKVASIQTKFNRLKADVIDKMALTKEGANLSALQYQMDSAPNGEKSLYEFLKAEAMTKKETDIKNVKEAKLKLTCLGHEKDILGDHSNTVDAANKSEAILKRKIDMLESRSGESSSSKESDKSGYMSGNCKQAKYNADKVKAEDNMIECVGPALASIAVSQKEKLAAEVEEQRERRRMEEEAARREYDYKMDELEVRRTEAKAKEAKAKMQEKQLEVQAKQMESMMKMMEMAMEAAKK